MLKFIDYCMIFLILYEIDIYYVIMVVSFFISADPAVKKESNKTYMHIACIMQLISIIVVSIFAYFVYDELDGLFLFIGLVSYIYKIIAFILVIKGIYAEEIQDVVNVIWNSIIYLIPFIVFIFCVLYTNIFKKIEVSSLLLIMFVLFW